MLSAHFYVANIQFHAFQYVYANRNSNTHTHTLTHNHAHTHPQHTGRSFYSIVSMTVTFSESGVPLRALFFFKGCEMELEDKAHITSVADIMLTGLKDL